MLKRPFLYIDFFLSCILQSVVFVGRLTSCPGYIGLTVNDRRDLEQVFRHDVLVSCPPRFSINITVPTWPSLISTSTDISQSPAMSIDKSFEVILDDAHDIFRVVTTTIRTTSDLGVQQIADCPLGVRQVAQIQSSWRHVVVICLTFFVVLVLAACVHAYLDYRPSICRPAAAEADADADVGRRRYQQRRCLCSCCCQRASADTEAVGFDADEVDRSTPDRQSGRSMPTAVAARSICVMHVLLRLCFGVSMTFTVTSLVFDRVHNDRFKSAAGLVLIPSRRDEAIRAAWSDLDIRVSASSSSWAGGDVRPDMQAACDGYVADLAGAMASRVDEYVNNQFDLLNSSSAEFSTREMSSSPSSLSSIRIVEQFLKRFRSDVENYTANCRRLLIARLRPLARQYSSLVSKLLDCPWLAYSMQLFNKTTAVSSIPDVANDSAFAAFKMADSNLHNDVNELFAARHDANSFSHFLEFHDLGDIRFMAQQFFERSVIVEFVQSV